MTLADWKILSEEPLFSAQPFIEVSSQKVELPNGRIVSNYYQLMMPDIATIFAETVEGKIILLRHYRHGVRRVCCGFPGGHIAPGEDPLEAAGRELLEETGYAASEMIFLGDFITNANHRGQAVNFYRAKGCRKIAEPDSGDLEEIEIILANPADLDAGLARGDFPCVGQIALVGLARGLISASR